jgi:hypothetical protein
VYRPQLATLSFPRHAPHWHNNVCSSNFALTGGGQNLLVLASSERMVQSTKVQQQQQQQH